MKTYKIKATMTVEVEQEIYADSEDEARSKFFEQSVSETIDEASFIEEIDTTVDEIELTEGTFIVKVTDIDYDIEDDNCIDNAPEAFENLDEDSPEFWELVDKVREDIRKELPTEMTLEISCEKEDLEDYIADVVSDDTNYLINSFCHEIIGVK